MRLSISKEEIIIHCEQAGIATVEKNGEKKHFFLLKVDYDVTYFKLSEILLPVSMTGVFSQFFFKQKKNLDLLLRFS